MAPRRVCSLLLTPFHWTKHPHSLFKSLYYSLIFNIKAFALPLLTHLTPTSNSIFLAGTPYFTFPAGGKQVAVFSVPSREALWQIAGQEISFQCWEMQIHLHKWNDCSTERNQSSGCNCIALYPHPYLYLHYLPAQSCKRCLAEKQINRAGHPDTREYRPEVTNGTSMRLCLSRHCDYDVV